MSLPPTQPPPGHPRSADQSDDDLDYGDEDYAPYDDERPSALRRAGVVAAAALAVVLAATGGYLIGTRGRTADIPVAASTSRVPSTSHASASASATPTQSGQPTDTASPTPTVTTGLAGKYPDGDFGYLKGVADASGVTYVSFDRALLYTGEEANKQAAARGDATPVPNDYYIVNDNKTLHHYVLASTATVVGNLQLSGTTTPTPTTFSHLVDYLQAHTGDQLGLPVRIWYGENDHVVKVQEIFFP